MKQNDKAFMTQGPINQVILSIAFPLMLNNLIRTIYNLTDGLYVARLSAEDFAATAFIWPLNFLFISIGIGISIGATSLIAKALGARDLSRAKTYAVNATFLTFSFGFVLALIGYLASGWMVGLMGAQGMLFDKSTTYLQINLIGLFFDFCYFAFQSLLNAQGKTRVITRISAISAVINVILDPIFIFDSLGFWGLKGMGWGIAGAAWATVLSKLILLLLAIQACRTISEIPLSLQRQSIKGKALKDILAIALPAAFGHGGAALGFTVLNGLIAGYGTATLAAYSMVNRITDLFTQPQMGIGGALTAIIGQNMGAKQYQRSKAIFSRARWLILLMSLVSSLILYFGRGPILMVFIKDLSDQALWTQAGEYLFYSCFIIFFMGLFSAYTGYFQGMGDTKQTMWMSIGRLWILRLPFIWAFQAWTNLGATGVWIAMLLSNALTVFYGALVYRRKNAQLIAKEEEHVR